MDKLEIIKSNSNATLGTLPRIGEKGITVPEKLVPMLKAKTTESKTGSTKNLSFEVAPLSYYAETLGLVKADMDKDEWKRHTSAYRSKLDDARRFIDSIEALASADRGLRGKKVIISETTSKSGVIRRKFTSVRQDPTIAEMKPSVRAIASEAQLIAAADRLGYKLVLKSEDVQSEMSLA